MLKQSGGKRTADKALKLMCVCVFAFGAIKMYIESALSERKSMGAGIFAVLMRCDVACSDPIDEEKKHTPPLYSMYSMLPKYIENICKRRHNLRSILSIYLNHLDGPKNFIFQHREWHFLGWRV